MSSVLFAASCVSIDERQFSQVTPLNVGSIL